MDLDIRLPIGMMFLVLGPLLLVWGLVDHAAITRNTGAAMIVFGLPMLLLGRAAMRR